MSEPIFDENVPVPILRAAKVVYAGLPVPEYPTLIDYIHEGVNGHFLPAVNWRKPKGKRDQWRITVRAFRDFLRAIQEDATHPTRQTADTRQRAEAARARIRAMR